MVNDHAQVHTVDRQQFASITQHARTNMWPEHWPAGVYMVSQDGLAMLGMDHRGNLYLDGERLYTERRLGRQERILAWILAVSAVTAALAATASAVADWVPLIR